MNDLQFLETTGFQKWVRKSRLRAAVARLCEELADNPEAGDVIPGGGGLRKVRMAGHGRGKSGGFRVIYVLVVNRAVAVLMKGYSKSEREDLTAEQLADLMADVAGLQATAEQLVRPDQADAPQAEV